MMKNNFKNKSQSLLKELQSLQLPEHEQFVKGFYFPSLKQTTSDTHAL